MITAKSTASTLEKQKIQDFLEQSSKNPGRRYYYCEEIKKSMDKKFNYWKDEVKADCYVKGFFGQISDCHILYAVYIMGTCDKDSIADFLYRYSNDHKDLQIPKDLFKKNGAYSALDRRLDELVRYGELIRINYREPVEKAGVALYCISKDGQTLMNKVLQKRCPLNAWEAATPQIELIGQASAARVCAAMMMQSGTVSRLREGVLKTQELGTAVLPPTYYCENRNGKHMVMTIPSYLKKVPEYQTDDDFVDHCIHRVNFIKNFLYFFTKTSKAEPDRAAYVVIVAQDAEDIDRMGAVIYASQSIIPHGSLDSIYITTEGIQLSVKDMKDGFLRYTSTEQEPMALECQIPPFLD